MSFYGDSLMLPMVDMRNFSHDGCCNKSIENTHAAEREMRETIIEVIVGQTDRRSDAAILQQTAEFVFNLEQDKNRLMSNVTYLRDLLLKHNINPDLPNVSVSSTGTTSATTSTMSGKKRKLDNVMAMQTISDSSDEGLGSMSPEPLTYVTVMPNGGITTTTSSSAASTSNILAKEVVDLKHQLEMERRQRMMLEEQLRQVECPVYPERLSREERLYGHQEVIEHTDNIRMDDSVLMDTTDGIEEIIEEDDEEDESTTISILNNNPMTKVSLSQLSELRKTHNLQDVQVLAIDSLPENGQNVVVCSPVHEINLDEARVLSPAGVEVVCKEEMEKVEISTKQRLQPILEAVIKAEPKVEVERISGSPVSLTVVKSEDSSTSSSAQQSRMYLTSTSRQNLETIVEAIRHLEGDHLFGETSQTAEQQPTQEAPLALTTKQSHVQVHPHTRKIHVDVNPFLHFRSPNATTAAQHLQQQCRPGVIVVKQNS
ncbi:hypothetical protein DMENIID0001_001330 [Sergentomyia squamirostris]